MKRKGKEMVLMVETTILISGPRHKLSHTLYLLYITILPPDLDHLYAHND